MQDSAAAMILILIQDLMFTKYLRQYVDLGKR
jgi:hypothetical protein